MKRRAFITLFGGAAAWPLAARAQQPVMPVIGFLAYQLPDAITDRLRGFRQGLKDTGYVEGENAAIVYRFVGDDPARLGLVTNLSRPGGNITGVNILTSELAGKRLELLRVLVPQAARVAVLVNPANVAAIETQLKDIGAAARAIGLQIQIHNANTSAEIDAAFETMSRERPDAVYVTTTAFLNGRRLQLAQLAAFHRLPALYGLRESSKPVG